MCITYEAEIKNLKVDSYNISKRAMSILEIPKYLNSELSDDFQFRLGESDKVLTVFHSGLNGQKFFLFSEILIGFTKGFDLNQYKNDLWKINFREIDSFLRDENHLSSFLNEIDLWEESFKKVRVSLIANLIRQQIIDDQKIVKLTVSHWENLSLEAKNRWAKEVLGYAGWELIFCEEKALTLTKSPAGITNGELELLIRQIFKLSEIELPLKVVAV
jgi:hypothetical protein